MCGLFGVFKPTHLSTEERKALVEIGMLSFFRGTDSTGISVLTKKKPKSEKVDHFIVKDTNHAIDFFKQEHVLNACFNQKATSIMGHARAATHGTVNQANAQPMRENSIVGTHNGVVRKFTPDKKEEDTHSDSRKLFHAIDNLPIETVLKSLYTNDSYALAFYDLEYNTLNFVRNDKRPLHIVKVGDEGTMFWASEEWVLIYALMKHGLTYEDLKIVPPEYLISISLLDGEPEVTKLKLSTTFSFEGSQSYTSYTSYPRTYDANILKPGATTQEAEASLKVVREAVASHAEMQDFMNKTRKDYIAGKTAATVSNVVPLTRTIMQQAEDELATKTLESQLDIVMSNMVKEAEASEASSPFRNGTRNGIDSHNLDKASYKLRRDGSSVWVSIPTAQSLLAPGCASCCAVNDVEDETWWRNHNEYLCGECHQDLCIIEYYGTCMSEFEEGELMLDTHISMYGG